MHPGPRTLDDMTPTLDSLTVEAATLGVHVTWAELPIEMDGAYLHQRRTIILAPGLADYAQAPALAHEVEHAKRGDDGHQTRRVEDEIDEAVACRFVDIFAYRRAEEYYGWNTPAIAAELDLPRWVVQAYRRALTRAAEQVLTTA